MGGVTYGQRTKHKWLVTTEAEANSLSAQTMPPQPPQVMSSHWVPTGSVGTRKGLFWVVPWNTF